MDFEGKKSKRGRLGEGRPTKRSPEVIAKIAEAVAIGLTDEEAALLAGINPDPMTQWRKDPEFSGAIKREGAQRLLLRLGRIEAGEQGWQGTRGCARLRFFFPVERRDERISGSDARASTSCRRERDPGTAASGRPGCRLPCRP